MQSIETVCLGLNYRTSPVEVRERLTCSLAHFHQTWPDVAAWASVCEAVVLATCNRWEFYARLDGAVVDAHAFLVELVAQTHGFTPAELAEHSYFYVGDEAHRHILRVACGLESQILGEAQILGQVADALRRSREHNFAGPALTAVFEAAIAAGKRARASTAINSRPASVSSVAVSLAQKLSGDLRQRRLLVVGLGEMGRLALRALRDRGVTEFAIVNRTYERALQLSSEMGCRAWRWEELDQGVLWADVIFIATTAHQPLLSCSLLQRLLPDRNRLPLVIIDIAVPRNVEPAVASLPGVMLVDIDDLQQGLDDGLAVRQAAVPQVEAIITSQLAALDLRLQELLIRPIIASLRQRAETIREQELARALKFLGDVDPATLDHLQHFSRALVNKLLHEPTARLREQAYCQDNASCLSTACYLFGLERGDSL